MKRFIAIFLALLMVVAPCATFVSALDTAGMTNIAAGKAYVANTIYKDGNNNIPYPDENGTSLTDGVIGDVAAAVYTSTIWTGFSVGSAKAVDAITVDLGKSESKLQTFALYAMNQASVGVTVPASLEVLISDDNTTFKSIGVVFGTKIVTSASGANDGIYQYGLTLPYGVSARYVRFASTHASNLAFYSEVEVYQNPAAAEPPVKTGESITIDGNLNDTGWAGDAWTNVNSLNATVGNIKEGEIRNDNFDYQMRSDDTTLYIGLRYNQSPVATDVIYGNGSGTFFRLWTYSDDVKVNGVPFATYTSFIDYQFRPSGSTVSYKKNTNVLGNSAIAAPINMTSASTSGNGYWYIEMAIPFSELGATTGAHFYLNFATPTAINGATVVSNNSWVYPKYGAGVEANTNADAPYANWDKNNDLDITFADINLGKTPAGAFNIDNFGDYVSGTMTIMSAVNGKSTLGEISAITIGAVKDYNYFYAAAVDANGTVTAINQTLGRPAGLKDTFTVPAGGYVLLCNGNEGATLPQAVIDNFKKIAVGDKIGLHNINLSTLATGAVKANLTGASFTVKKGYNNGVTLISDPAKVVVLNNKNLSVLSDGDKGLAATSFSDPQVILFQNLTCTTAGQYPTVDIILTLNNPTAFDSVNLAFYHEYNSMIGLPKDNKVSISYSELNPTSFTAIGDFTVSGKAEAGITGTVDNAIALGKTITAKYVKVSFAFGDSPFAGATPSKPVWEFVGMTEFSVSRKAIENGIGNVVANSTYVTTDQVTANKVLDVLANGNKGSTATTFADAQVVLFQNKVCTTAGTYPKVELILALTKVTTFDTINMTFYHEYNSMVGLPKDNKVSFSYTNDLASAYTDIGDYTFTGAAVAGSKGALDAKFSLGKTVRAKYVKVSFAFGDSPFAGATPSKPVWEFIGLTEVAVSGYAAGVTNLSASGDVGILNGRPISLLWDGNKASSLQSFMDPSVMLFQNKKCTTAGTYPTVDLLYAIDQPADIDTVNLSFYHEYDSMIGLPKDNKVSVSYGNDSTATFTSLGDYTFTGAAETGKKGIIDAKLALGKTINAKYIRITFKYGDSPFAPSKPVWEFIALTEVGVSGANYTKGVNNISDVSKVGVIKELALLTDGNKALDATAFSNPQVVLFQNKLCTTAGTYPTTELVLALDQQTLIDTVNLDFYHEYNSMIGLPKDNKVTISYATDPAAFTALGEYTITGTAAAGTSGVIDAAISLGKAVEAKYIKVSFAFGDSPFAGATPSKPVWEFIALTEFSAYKSTPVTVDGSLNEKAWASATWNTVNKYNGTFQDPYAGKNLPNFAYDWAVFADDTNLYVAVKINQTAHSILASGETLSNVKATNVRFWVDNDMSTTTRSGLYDFTFDGTSCIETRATKSSDSVSALSKGSNYTYYEFSVKLSDLGYDPAKVFGIYLTVSDVNLTNSGAAYDALHCKTYTNVNAPWSTTADYYKVKLGREYASGVSLFSNTDHISASNLDKLTDGNKGLDAGDWGTGTSGVVLFQNKVCTNADINPAVDFVLNLGEIQSVDKVVLDFYHCYNVMIGLPKDNKVKLTYSMDGITYSDLGTFTFTGTAEAGKFGTIEATFDVKDVKARYIGVSFDIGPSGLTTDGKVVWEFVSMTEASVVKTARTYPAGVSNFSYSGHVATGDLALLTDGNKGLDAGNWGTGTSGVVLLTNKVCTDATINPTVDFVLNLGSVKSIDKVVLDFYHCYNVMIGLPKDNLVRLSYSADGVTFTDIGRYTFDGKAEAGKFGTIEAAFNIKNVDAQYIGISFDIGPSGLTTDNKVVWEFVSMTEAYVQTVSDLPTGAIAIDNFGEYIGSTTTILTRVGDKKTIGDVSTLLKGVLVDYNYFYLVGVDSNGKVVAVNKVLGRPDGKKDTYEIPEGGYVLLCNATAGGSHTQASIDSFLALGIGDTITLYNTDLAYFTTNAARGNLLKAGFTVAKFDYAKGITNISDSTKVGIIKELALLTDGNKALDATAFSNAQVVLFQNKLCTTAGTYPTVDLVLTLDAATDINTLNMSFYHEYASMIGLPKDNKITVSYATAPTTFTALGDFTFTGTAASGTKGVIDAKIDLGKTVNAKYIKISFAYGDSPFAGATPSKPVWEFVALTEISVSKTIVNPFELITGANATVENGMLTGLKTGMTVDQIKALFKGEVTVSGIGTGSTVTAGGQTITIVIKGDVYGDGKIDSRDFLLVKRAYLGTINLNEFQLKAALLSGYDTPKPLDFLKIKRHFIGTYDIFTGTVIG